MLQNFIPAEILKLITNACELGQQYQVRYFIKNKHFKLSKAILAFVKDLEAATDYADTQKQFYIVALCEAVSKHIEKKPASGFKQAFVDICEHPDFISLKDQFDKDELNTSSKTINGVIKAKNYHFLNNQLLKNRVSLIKKEIKVEKFHSTNILKLINDKTSSFNETDNLSQLPNEITYLIASFLPEPSDIRSWQCTSSFFSNLFRNNLLMYNT